MIKGKRKEGWATVIIDAKSSFLGGRFAPRVRLLEEINTCFVDYNECKSTKIIFFVDLSCSGSFILGEFGA